MRQRVRQFLASYKGFIRGGLYSLETTYNRREKTWHIHTHILADVCASLPSPAQKLNLFGRYSFAFLAIKLRMEYDWLRLWESQWGKAVPAWSEKAYARSTPERRAALIARDRLKWEARVNGEHYDFEKWVRLGRDMAVKEKRGSAWVTIPGLSPAVLAARSAWNADNRRVVDIRRVNDRDRAAREVLKYLTKVADFCDLPEAVEPFVHAVGGARLIQTFGSWYGVSLDTSADFDPENFEDWGEMKCACGVNDWERMGAFFRSDVEMSAEGRWFLKSHIDHNCRGTVPRPTIRALDVHEE